MKKATSNGYPLYDSTYRAVSNVKNLELENTSAVATETREIKEGSDYEGLARERSFMTIE